MGSWPAGQQPVVFAGSEFVVNVEETDGGEETGIALIRSKVILISQPVHPVKQALHKAVGMVAVLFGGTVIWPKLQDAHDAGLLQLIDQPIVIGQLKPELSIV